MTRPLVIVVWTVFALMGTACHTPSSSSPNHQPGPTAFDRQQSRQSYVESHYDKYLKGGRVPDENAARAMAGLEWDTHARRNHERDTETMRWSSGDRAKSGQRAFEEKLRELGY